MAKVSTDVIKQVKDHFKETGGRELTIGDKVYEVTGNKRLTVKEVLDSGIKGVKITKVKESKPNRIIQVCEECGEEFENSKFTPYFTMCRKCRKGSFKDGTTNRCTSCGVEFNISKFQSAYITKCPECR